MQNMVITGLDPVIQALDQVVKNWMPRSSRGMTWVGAGASWYKPYPSPERLASRSCLEKG